MTTRLSPVLLLLACVGALGAVLVAQFGFDLAPCHLCTLQRVPYAFGVLIALAGALERDARQRSLLLGTCALIFATNIGLAFFHIGVEQHWWEAACTEGEKLANTAGGLLAKLKAGKPPPACDSVPFALFGISLAGLNLIFSIVLTVYAALAARRTLHAA